MPHKPDKPDKLPEQSSKEFFAAQERSKETREYNRRVIDAKRNELRSRLKNKEIDPEDYDARISILDAMEENSETGRATDHRFNLDFL